MASTAWPATENTAGRWSRSISSSAAPPTTWRVTTNGASPWKDSTFAAIATPARAATWAISSLPRSVPAAITTTALLCSRTVRIAEAQAAPEYAASGVAPDVVDVADAVGRELLAQLVGHALSIAGHDDRVDRHATARGGERPGEGQRLQRHLDGGPVQVLLDQGQDHRASTPSSSNRSTTAGAAAAPSPRICTLLGTGGGSVSFTRFGPLGSADGVRSSTGTFFAFIRPGTLG